jgi:hypothetical protein
MKRDQPLVFPQDLPGTRVPYELRDGSFRPHFSSTLADLLRGFDMTVTLAARRRSFAKCSSYSTALPIESARMSIPFREERSKCDSEPSSLRMKPQPILLFSRVTEPRTFAPLFPAADFSRVATFCPESSIHSVPAILSIGNGRTSTASFPSQPS